MRIFWFALTFAVIAGCTAFAQHDTRAELHIRGGSEGIFVKPDESIWIATKTGDTYYTNRIDQPWHHGYFQSDEWDFNLHNTFERVLFFNDTIGFISGYIYGKDDNTDIVYRTTNGGKKWKAVPFGKEAWIDAACANENGKAWMAGNSQLIYYSDDFGKTWRYKNRPEDTTNQRILTIYFLNDYEGIAGTGWNRIYYTKDNCESWQIVETPSDQQKSQALFIHERPEINQALLTPTQLIIKQNNHVFYSRKDSIVWQKLADITDFEYDKKRNVLYLIDRQLNVCTVNGNIENPRKQIARLNKEPHSLFARNGSLYVWSRDEITRINDNSVYTTTIYTEEDPIKNLNFKAKADHKTWGASESHVYQSDNDGKSWYRVKQLDFSIGHIKPLNDSILVVSNENLSRFYLLNISDGRLEDYPLSNRVLRDFTLNNITSVLLESGSTGCFHHYSSDILFSKDGANFKATRMTSDQTGEEEGSDINRAFFGEELVFLLELIKPENKKKLTFADFGITENHRDIYRKIIDSLEQANDPGDYYEPFSLPYRNVDYSFFRNYEKKLAGVSADTLKALVSESTGNPSTTTNWRKITITTHDGQELTLTNADYAPNAWYLPWFVEVDGFVYKSVRPEVGKFYLKYFTGQLPETENARLIFDLAKRGYEALLKNK